MGPKVLSTKQEIASKEVEKFAYDVYDYLFNTYKFFSADRENKFMKQVSKRLSSEDKVVKHFNDAIGKAVRVSEFLLREHFANLLLFTYSDENIFKKEVKLMWKHWLENRTNSMVKVIDTLAIIAIIFLHCDSFMMFSYELNDAAGWFMEWFKEDLEFQFFRSGGWKQLQKISIDWYTSLILYVDDHPDIYGGKARPVYCEIDYNCNLIRHLETSPVLFPVPKSKICESCRDRLDKEGNARINPVYVRVEREYMQCSRFKNLFDQLKCVPPQEESLSKEVKPKTSGLPKEVRKDEYSEKNEQVYQPSTIESSLSQTDNLKDAISETLTAEKQKRSLPSIPLNIEQELRIKDSSSTEIKSRNPKTGLPIFPTKSSTNLKEWRKNLNVQSSKEQTLKDESTDETQEHKPFQIKPELKTLETKKSPVSESSSGIILKPTALEQKKPVEDSAITEQVSIEPSSAEEILKPVDVEHKQNVTDSTQIEKVSQTSQEGFGVSRLDSLAKQIIDIPRVEEASVQLPKCTPYGNFLAAVEESGPIQEEKFNLLSEKYSYSFNNMCNEKGESFRFKVFPYNFFKDGKPKRERIPNTLSLINHKSPAYLVGVQSKTRKISSESKEVKTSEGRKKSGSQKRKGKSKNNLEETTKLESEKNSKKEGKSEGEEDTCKGKKSEEGICEVEKKSEGDAISEVKKESEEEAISEAQKMPEEEGKSEVEKMEERKSKDCQTTKDEVIKLEEDLVNLEQSVYKAD